MAVNYYMNLRTLSTLSLTALLLSSSSTKVDTTLRDTKSLFENIMSCDSSVRKMIETLRIDTRDFTLPKEMVERVGDIMNKINTELWKNSPFNTHIINICGHQQGFTMLNGRIYITRGMIELNNLTDDEIAFIIGHEIGHYVFPNTSGKNVEFFADEFSVLLMKKLGFNTAWAVTLLEKLKSSGQSDTHPMSQERIENIKKYL